MTSIFITFINDKVKIIRKNGVKIDEIKPFSDKEGEFTTVAKNRINLEFLPQERPYVKGNIPFTNLTLYKGEIASYLGEALEYFSKVTLQKERFNEIYIITDNQPYVVPEFKEIIDNDMKVMHGAKYKGCYFIPLVFEAILEKLAQLKMNDYLLITDTMVIASSYKKKLNYFQNLYIDPLVPKNKGLIEEIYHKTNLSLIYDSIPYELIGNMMLGGIKKYLNEEPAQVSYKAQDRLIEISEEDIIECYNEAILDKVKSIVKEIYNKGMVVSFYTESKVFEKDLEDIVIRNCRMMFPKHVFFSYVEFLGLINNDMFIKTIKIAHNNKDTLYSKIPNMGRNTKKYEKAYYDIFKDYKKFF